MAPQLRKRKNLILLQKVTAKLKFFKSLNEDFENVKNRIHEKCCRVMQHIRREKGESVCWVGDQADNFYIILNGAVNVYVTKSSEMLHQENEAMSQIFNPVQTNESGKKTAVHYLTSMMKISEENGIGRTSATTTLEEKLLGGLSVKEIHEFWRLFFNDVLKYIFRVTLHTGHAFGEIGLLHHVKRTATIICKEDTHFAIVKKSDFE